MGLNLKSVKKSTVEIAKEVNKPVNDYLRSKIRRRNTAYAKLYKHCKVKKNVVLYEAFYGRGMLCNPYAIFKELLDNPKYKNLKHIWVLDDLSAHKDEIEKYGKYDNVYFVESGKKPYLKALCTAKYLINNSTFLSYFVKKPEQIYINTWHGIPLKTLGYDHPLAKISVSNTVRNFIQSDYLISANSFLTEIYTRAYKLDGIYKGKIIEEGYPRLDTVVKTERKDVIKLLKKEKVKVDENKKIVLYAPTWKGRDFYNPDCDINDYLELKETIESKINCDEYQVLIKVHQAVYDRIRDEISDYPFIVPATIDANIVLSATDILISDYSSIYFDFLATGRPVLFYIPDVENYKEYRGMYFGIDELPGPYTDSVEQIADWINDIDSVFENVKEKYQRIQKWCCDFEPGKIASKIVKVVFEKDESDMCVKQCQNNKEKILFIQGNMAVNGITSALLNLLNEIDYDKYDVTVYANFKDKAQHRAGYRVNDNARLISRTGPMVTTISEMQKVNLFHRKGFTSVWGKVYPEKVYQREFRRCLGDTHFDYIIDFDGYNIFYSSLVLQDKDAVKSIWLHSDMASEMEVRFPWLKKIFTLYPKFDRIVSCSKDIMLVNRKNIATEETYNKFVYAKNAVDYQKVLNGLKKSVRMERNGKDYYVQYSNDVETDVTKLKFVPLSPIDIVDINAFDTDFSVEEQEWNKYGIDVLTVKPKKENAEAKEIVVKDEKLTRFMTVGRLSPEKNYVNLVKAFAKYLEEGHNAMLYLIGDGPLKEEIDTLIDSLNIRSRVILVGILENPSELLKYCDCFIFTSLHEGQPVVIHEARVAGLPIVMTKFSSYKGSVVKDGQYLIGMDEEGILKGMNAFANGEVPTTYEYDYVKNNHEVYKEFLTAIGAEN